MTQKKKNILVVEDDHDILNLVKDYLKASNYNTYLAKSGDRALELFDNETIHMVILDLMIPKVNGFEVCRRIRKDSNVPIIILSAKKEESDKILGLGLGADDYITKPFSPRELIARVKSHFRRFNELNTSNPEKTEDNDLIKFSNLTINSLSREVTINDKIVDFSAKEFDLLYFLAKNENQVLSKEKIFNKIWGFNNFGDINTVTVHIGKIREKVEENPSEPKIIKTVWGVGYKFVGQ